MNDSEQGNIALIIQTIRQLAGKLISSIVALPGLILTCVRSPLNCLCRIWRWILDLWLVLRPCRFSLFSLIVGFVFFGISPQGIDILRGMTETRTASFWQLLIFYVCIWIWALNIWYWARHMLTFEHIYLAATATINQQRSSRFVEEVPRYLGALAFIAIWFASIKTSRAYPEALQDTFAVDPDWLAYVYFFSALVFYAFARGRRWIFGNMLGLKKSDSLHESFHTRFSQLPKIARLFAIGIMTITLVAFVWTSIDPVSAGRLGTANLLLLAAANWVFIGTVLVFYGDKFRVPIFLILVVWAIIISPLADNHVMRTTGEFSKETRPHVETDFNLWLKQRINDDTEDHSYPVFLVAAEGGGIRAAYWTAILLGAMQDNNPAFASHVYALSGISGGSLGSAVFTALLKQGNNAANVMCPTPSSYRDCADKILAGDFLGPTAGRMLYGDFVQRFFPVPVSFFDRARAIEDGWETAFAQHTGADFFGQDFMQLYDTELHLPALFLNTTWVEAGRRVVASNLLLDNDDAQTLDLHSITGRHLPLSTAVHNSARFSYVSPAGTVLNKNEHLWGHLVDGGYFENSGTTTLLEVLQSMRAGAGDHWKKIRPIVLMITNDPLLNDLPVNRANKFANELLSPVSTMLNTRSARGAYARDEIYYAVTETGYFVHFGLQDIEGPVPLGWVLSDAAKDTMKKRLACYLDALPDKDPLKINASRRGTLASQRIQCKGNTGQN